MSRRCYGHNLVTGCPQRIRCFVCRILSDVGQVFTSLALHFGRGKFQKVVR